MRWAWLLVLAACPKPSAPPAWPAELAKGWTRVELRREERRVAVEKKDGAWRLVAPRKGDADPDTVDRLQLALTAPQVLAAKAEGQANAATWELWLEAGAKKWHVTGTRTGLSNPLTVRVEGVGEFTVSPVEMANQVPDPDDFLTPGLWIAAKDSAHTFEVLKGPQTYALVGEGEEWHLADGGVATRDLDDFPGIVIGRQAIGHPVGQVSELGLDPPTAKVQLCTTTNECRVFLFGKAGEHHYAMAPDSDPIELRASDWNLIVNGP